MNNENYASTLKSLLNCDRVWVQDAMMRHRRRDVVEPVLDLRMRIHNEVDIDRNKIVTRYGRMWERMRDINVDVSPFVEIEKDFIESIGFEKSVTCLHHLLNRLKTVISNAAMRRLNSRQYEYVFHGRVKH